MFDFIDCLEAEIVPGYEPKRLPPRFGGSQAGAAVDGGLIPAARGAHALGCGQRREQLPRAGGCGWHPVPRPVVPCICDVPERNVHGFSPVPTTAFAPPEALWIPQTSRNDTEHFGDIRCVVVYSKFQASPLISRVGMP